MKTKKITPTTIWKEWKEETEHKHWDWPDLSSGPEDGHLGSFLDGLQAKESEKEGGGGEDHDDQVDGTGWGAGYKGRGDTVYDHLPANWLPTPIHHPNHHYRIGLALCLY
jgi:hypothetical protein